jgi:ankyrin repeat protein
LLLEKGAQVNAADAQGYTPLHWAVASRACARLLLDRGADANAAAKDGMTPLMAAANANTPNATAIAALLLDKGANVNARFTGEGATGRTPLHFAVYAKSLPMVTLLVAHNADVNAKAKDGATALSIAKRIGEAEIARYLRAHGAK